MASPTVQMSPHVTYGLRALFATIFLVAIALGWFVDHSRLKARLDAAESVIRKGKIELLDRLERPGVVGQPVIDFPGVASLADIVFDETMEGFQDFDPLSTNPDGTQYSNRRLYVFVWDDKLAEGHTRQFTVVTSNDVIVFVDAPHFSY